MKDQRETINQIREFNRFYTVLLGFLNRNYLDSGYSVTETRILFELKQHGQMSANQIIDMLHLDKSYISRLIRNFEQKGIVIRETDSADRRSLIIRLTLRGQAETDRLIDTTNQEIRRLIESFDDETCRDLCQSMKQIITIFSNKTLQEEHHENQC